MPLAMSRPWKHPKTGIYQLRKAVPDDLRQLVGKREEKVSLQTRYPAEAKVRHAKALAEFEARWANLRAGPKFLTEREAHQLAIVSYDRWLEQYRDNPSQGPALPSRSRSAATWGCGDVLWLFSWLHGARRRDSEKTWRAAKPSDTAVRWPDARAKVDSDIGMLRLASDCSRRRARRLLRDWLHSCACPC